MMQPQRRMNNNISEMEERKEQKEQARKKRMMEAAAQAAYKYPEDLKEAEFNLQPQQQTDENGAVLHFIIRKALGDHNLFRKVLRQGKESERLLLGLDNTVPGTPEVNDVDFDNPLNGHLNTLLGKVQGKNGTTNHVQQLFKKVKHEVKNEFAEPKGKAEPKASDRPVAKPKPLPKPLDMQRQTTKETTKNPNNIDIGDILKKMTQTLPDTLTDIETPGKVPTSKTFQFPQTASQIPQVTKLDEKVDMNGRSCKEEYSTIKKEPRDNAADSRNTFKKVGPDKKNPPDVKVGSGPKTKPSRKVSTSSVSSSDDSSSESSGSSDSESEKVKENRSTKKEPRSAINSPLVQNSPSKLNNSPPKLNNSPPKLQNSPSKLQNSPSKMHKTEFGCSSYILNKENKLHPGLPYNYSTDISLKHAPISEMNDFPYVQPQKNPETDESALIDNHPSLSPMDIETISPLDPSSLFDGLEFTTWNGGDEFIPSVQTKTDDFGKVSNESAAKNRLKQTNINDDFREPSLDDSLDDSSNNLILNKHKKGTGVLYQKDSKSNSKLYKSNETKHISKSKSTRIDSGPTVPTKAARKYIPEQRRKSVSDNSDKDSKEDTSKNTSKKSKDSLNKKNTSAEKTVKREKLPKRDRLKPKVNISKDITVVKSDDNDSSDDKKAFLNITSLPPATQPTTSTTANDKKAFLGITSTLTPQPTSTTSTDTMPTLIKSTTCCPIMQNQIPQLTDSVCTIHTDFIPPTLSGYPVDDKCFFDDTHGTSNLYSMSTSFGTTLSPMNSPECLIKYQEPPTLVKEIKEEGMRSGYDISASDIITVELKSPVNTFVALPSTGGQLVNVALNDNIMSSQETLVHDIFTSQTRINDMNYSINDIFPPSLGLDELKPQPLLLPEINSESTLLDPLRDIKPDISELQDSELWVNDDPYSVNDIENIVPKIPVHHQLPSNTDVLNSKGILNVRCFDPISNFNHINPSLTIKIPLNGIKLKSNKYRNRTSTCKDMDSSLSPTSDSFEIDVVNDCSPLKRKRKKHHKGDDECGGGSTISNTIKDAHKKTDCEFETPNKEEFNKEKLIIRISLAKLKRAPLKGATSDQISKGKGGRPPKISRLSPEHPQDVYVSSMEVLTNQDAVIKEQSPIVMHNYTSDLLPSSPPLLDSEEKKTEDCHKNDLSQTEIFSSSDKDTKKKRGRPPKEKINKPEVKHRQSKHETPDSKDFDTDDDDVCHECGTLRKDYGRDPGRINSYKNTYSAYYTEARGCKHRADNLKTPIERAHKYTEAVLKYVQYLIGLELSGKMNVMQGVDEYMQITSECIQLVDYVVTHYGRKENPSNDVRFTLLCLRLQSILYLKLFKVKKESAMKYSKVLSRYFKNFKAAGHTGPTPYPKPVHNRGSTGTPSPSSPSPGPSPGGSVASIGSAGSSSGSTGSNDITANGIGQYVTIPTDVHEKAFQHLQYSKNLLHGHLLWEDSESLISRCQPFIIKLSRKAGHLTMQSSMLHVVDYVTAGLELIKESPHS